MTSSASSTRRPMPTYLYAGMLAASNRQVQVLDASSATSKVGMPVPHPSAHQHGVNTSTHASSEQVFNDTIASHLEFPYFFSASSRARVTTLEPGNHRRVPTPQPGPAKWLAVPLTTRHKNSCSEFLGGCRHLEGSLPAQHSARPHPKAHVCQAGFPGPPVGKRGLAAVERSARHVQQWPPGRLNQSIVPMRLRMKTDASGHARSALLCMYVLGRCLPCSSSTPEL